MPVFGPIRDVPPEEYGLKTFLQQIKSSVETLIEWCRSQFDLLASHSHYIDRGDPVLNDFTKTDFTTDGTWRDLDLSSIVPSGAKVVLIRVQITDDAVNSVLEFRQNGNSNTANISEIYTQVSGVVISADLMVSCDTNRIIEYFGSNLEFTVIYLTVKGWFL